MQTLAQTLQDYDRGHLKVIADLWGVDFPNENPSYAVDGLSSAMLDRTPAILETLPGGAMRALERILESGGRVPMEALVRQFGPLREMGEGKRDRLEPWKEPASPLEMLWYRGLMSKAFADSDSGPQEYGFVPDDLLDRMPEVRGPEGGPLGEATPAPGRIVRSGSDPVDDGTTILAAHRRAGKLDRKWLTGFIRQPASMELIEDLLVEAEILEDPNRVREFLEMTVNEAIQLLQETWSASTVWNDLSQTSEVISSAGKWPNDPLVGRRAALDLLGTVPAGTWWSISSFVDSVHELHPEFMRPPGGFDSWYLQSAKDGESLHGFESWERVEQPYLEHLIKEPMLWLGFTEISQDGTAFRLVDGPMSDRASKDKNARALRDGRIRVARDASRALRYQIARMCEWERMDAGAYYYRLTASSLISADGQGLKASHAVKLLSDISAPENLVTAVERWKIHGRQAGIERVTILRVDSPETLKMLIEHPTTRRYVSEQLGSQSLVIEPRNVKRLQEAALRLGLLIDASED